MKTYVVAMHAKIFTLLVLLLIAGCSSVPSVLYKIDVQQGNVITQEMVEKLKPGMTRSQVRFVLGSALIGDIFHENRWDYVYRLMQNGILIEQYKLTVFFEEDKLARTEGDFSESFASVSPQLVEPAKFPTEEKRDTELSPEPTVPNSEQDVPTILAIEEKYDTTSSSEPTVPSVEEVLPPPPPGIADGIEAD
ncbi:MAG: outer membrane protein assembly factor BamE [Nitrosomonadaceae bacterium]